MIVRPVAALGWAVVSGLAGGWLLLSPWSLGLQAAGGGWTDAMRSVVATGAFLVLLAVVAILVAIADVLRTFRTLGIVQPKPSQSHAASQSQAPTQPAAAAPGAPADVDMDNLLAALARVLADELSQQREADHELQRREPTWREQR
ncbi:MAG: hypothetical protein J2P40_07930 [Candidatus Dormibacteraeota bacterium]|nr:hypothetical protein [Candidatus Dormibacteraeota bacterium]MBO0761188.1 hypothetical protein [Candidatus Dormibacteraeota bacterium]